MTLFDLHRAAMDEYRAFVRAFLPIANPHIRDYVDREVMGECSLLWPEPLVQLSPSYVPGPTVDELADAGTLTQHTAAIFRAADGAPFRLYRHQQQAIEAARVGHSFVVTSGTGSGKSLCYFIPIADDVLRRPEPNNHVVALVVYPMNALVNSQHQALARFKQQYEQRTGQAFPLTFARYTGETGDDERRALRDHPPHILLTNYVMGELMMVRPEDRALLGEAALRFLVFDELHTYRGRQGADVAMLVRRLKARFAAPGLIHIGTSATMVAEQGSAPEMRRAAVAEFARRFFGHPFQPDDVIEETLRPATGAPPDADEVRRAADDAPPDAPPDAPADFRAHPLARWMEYALGVEAEADGRLRRRAPRSLGQVARELAGLTGAVPEQCRDRLQQWLIQGATLQEAGRPVFAFKLHQFISQGRALAATLQPDPAREFSIEGQPRLSDDCLLIPLRFCRRCGQEYYHVARAEGSFLPVAAAEELEEDGASARRGYLMLAPEAGDWSQEQLPAEWLDERGRVKRDYRERVPQAVWVHPDGRFAAQPQAGAVKMWWQPEKFSLCLNCGAHYTQREAEFTKLAGLSSEGRSSATTVLAMALLRHAGQGKAVRDKLLTFTDNRQDASLQAGHFNDFVQVALLRSALYAALQHHDELRAAEVAVRVVAHCGLDLRDYARSAELDPSSLAAGDARETFTRLTEYRLYEDLRRGWRFTRPNLEQVGLLRVDYRGLEACCGDQSRWESDARLRPLAGLAPEQRAALMIALLDHLRRNLAINAAVLQRDQQDRLRREAEQRLNAFWGLDEGDVLREATAAAWVSGSGHVSLGGKSQLGRFFKRELALADNAAYEQLMQAVLGVLCGQDILRRVELRNKQQGFQLNADALIWRMGDGRPRPDPLQHRRAAGYAEQERAANAYFQQLYQLSAGALTALEAREHTAQVVAEGERERRERRFRWEPGDATKERELGRRLPYLVCSPTMELGVDIADLELVHLRNMPPTPANYAQRSGRAGRQGQPGLIVTYCSAYSNHDQYFFANQQEMVAGSVRAPRLDLANDALLRAHIHAIWLAEVGLPLGRSIEETLTIAGDDLPLNDNARGQIELSAPRQARVKEMVLRALSPDRDALQQATWWSEQWVADVVRDAPQAFDRAFDRWREMYRSARQQFDQAQQARRQARRREDQDRERRREDEAERQLNLLLQRNVQREEGDFYPYRYLASEGFLPGYNFPALPVRAWVPRGGAGEFISRPRFLGIGEFAPGNIVYHEGAKWRVMAFQAPPGGLRDRCETIKVCRRCGAFCEQSNDVCPACGARLDGDNSQIVRALEMPNARLRRYERITSDEEERSRRGYDIEAVYRFAEARERLEADVVSENAPLFRLVYAPAAEIRLLNHGRRSAQTPGFTLNLDTGEWIEDAESAANAGAGNVQAGQAQRLHLMVRNTQNLLLLRQAERARPCWVTTPGARSAMR